MVQFSSLDEVYGKDFREKYNHQEDMNKVNFQKDTMPLYLQNKGYNQQNCFEVKSPQSSFTNIQENRRYQEMQQKSEEDRMKRNQHMNQIERYSSPMKVEHSPTPIPQMKAEDDLRKKQLLDKLAFIENELKKYQVNTPQQTPTKSNQQQQISTTKTIESFQNLTPAPLGNSTQQEFVELILLTILGLVFIFIMDTIFKLGKTIGAKKL